MSDTSQLTTAEILGAYYKELVAQGIPADIVRHLVATAAREVAQDGIVIRSGS